MPNVARPFCTPHRRFAAGQPVSAADVTGHLSLEEWRAAGFVDADMAAAPSPVAEPSAETHDAEAAPESV